MWINTNENNKWNKIQHNFKTSRKKRKSVPRSFWLPEAVGSPGKDQTTFLATRALVSQQHIAPTLLKEWESEQVFPERIRCQWSWKIVPQRYSTRDWAEFESVDEENCLNFLACKLWLWPSWFQGLPLQVIKHGWYTAGVPIHVPVCSETSSFALNHPNFPDGVLMMWVPHGTAIFKIRDRRWLLSLLNRL